MQEQEQICALRALTICDGHSVASGTLRGRVRCWCLVAADALAAGDHDEVSEARWERARMVARYPEVERSEQVRQKLVAAAERRSAEW